MYRAALYDRNIHTHTANYKRTKMQCKSDTRKKSSFKKLELNDNDFKCFLFRQKPSVEFIRCRTMISSATTNVLASIISTTQNMLIFCIIFFWSVRVLASEYDAIWRWLLSIKSTTILLVSYQVNCTLICVYICFGRMQYVRVDYLHNFTGLYMYIWP